MSTNPETAPATVEDPGTSEIKERSDTLAMHEEEDANWIEFEFSHDIYIYTLLLFERVDKEGLPLIHRFSSSRRLTLIYFTVGCWLLQMIAIMYLFVVGLFNGEEIFYEQTMRVRLDCNGASDVWNPSAAPSVNATNVVIKNQKCEFYTSDRVDFTDHTPPIIGAKIIAVLLVAAFVSTDLTSLPRYTVLMCATRSWTMWYWWVFMFGTTLLIVVGTTVRVFSLVYNSGKITDILSVGIGFILLMELDNKIFDVVKGGNMFGDELFELRFKRQALRDTVYHGYYPESYDMFIWFAFAVGCVIQAVLYSVFWEGDASPTKWAVQIIVPTFAAVVLQIIPVFYPFVYTIYRKCKVEKAKKKEHKEKEEKEEEKVQ